MRKKWWLIGPVAIAGIVLVVFISGEIVKLLWNWLLPDLFGFRAITFWQAAGVLALCRILFGGSRLGRWGRGRSKIGRRMAERWDSMTPEERERFREGLRRCGYEPKQTAES